MTGGSGKKVDIMDIGDIKGDVWCHWASLGLPYICHWIPDLLPYVKYSIISSQSYNCPSLGICQIAGQDMSVCFALINNVFHKELRILQKK